MTDLSNARGVVMVNRVIAAPVDLVWRTFVDPSRRAGWAAELSLTVVEPGRRCVVALAGAPGSPATRRTYAFDPIEVGPHRGGTVVTVFDDRVLADRLFDLVSGGFLARTVEGAVRRELDELAAACVTVVNLRAA